MTKTDILLRSELVAALDDMIEDYEMEERITRDSLDALRLRAQRRVASDLRTRLATRSESNAKGESDG